MQGEEYHRAYILEVQQQVVRGQRAAGEEVLGHPAVAEVVRVLAPREDVHKELRGSTRK